MVSVNPVTGENNLTLPSWKTKKLVECSPFIKHLFITCIWISYGHVVASKFVLPRNYANELQENDHHICIRKGLHCTPVKFLLSSIGNINLLHTFQITWDIKYQVWRIMNLRCGFAKVPSLALFSCVCSNIIFFKLQLPYVAINKIKQIAHT